MENADHIQEEEEEAKSFRIRMERDPTARMRWSPGFDRFGRIGALLLSRKMVIVLNFAVKALPHLQLLSLPALNLEAWSKSKI